MIFFFVCSFSTLVFAMNQQPPLPPELQEILNGQICAAEIARVPVEDVLNIPQGRFVAFVKSICDKEKKYKILGRYEPTQKDIAEILAKAVYKTAAHCGAHAITTKTFNHYQNTDVACFEAKDVLVVALQFANGVSGEAYYRVLCSEAHRNEGIIADFLQVWLPRNGKAAKWSDAKLKCIAHKIGKLVAMRPYEIAVANALQWAEQGTTIKFKGGLGQIITLEDVVFFIYQFLHD